MHFTPTVLSQSAVKVLCRADIVTTARTAKNVNPATESKKMGWVGLEPTTNALKGRYYQSVKLLL
jgi:hypothetical protein